MSTTSWAPDGLCAQVGYDLWCPDEDSPSAKDGRRVKKAKAPSPSTSLVCGEPPPTVTTGRTF